MSLADKIFVDMCKDILEFRPASPMRICLHSPPIFLITSSARPTGSHMKKPPTAMTKWEMS